MSSIRVSTELAASPVDVWAGISDVAFDYDTKVGPLRLTDRIHARARLGGPT